jgi:ribosomal protein S11
MKCDDWCAAVRLHGATAEQAAKALQALGVAAKKLEDETKELIDVRRARQPWLRRWRW